METESKTNNPVWSMEAQLYLSKIQFIRPVKKPLEELGFNTAPASKGHHLACEGGLCAHSVNVTRWLLKLTDTMRVQWPRPESPYIIGMFHDLVKCKCYSCSYADNPKGWDAKKVFVIRHAEHEYPGHGEASALIAATEIGFPLLPVETACIVYHMGAFCLDAEQLSKYDFALSRYPRELIATHTADMLAARVDEEFDHTAPDGSETK